MICVIVFSLECRNPLKTSLAKAVILPVLLDKEGQGLVQKSGDGPVLVPGKLVPVPALPISQVGGLVLEAGQNHLEDSTNVHIDLGRDPEKEDGHVREREGAVTDQDLGSAITNTFTCWSFGNRCL